MLYEVWSCNLIMIGWQRAQHMFPISCISMRLCTRRKDIQCKNLESFELEAEGVIFFRARSKECVISEKY